VQRVPSQALQSFWRADPPENSRGQPREVDQRRCLPPGATSPRLDLGRYAFGAFAILDGGLELASDGLSTFVLIGFIFVWLMLFAGQAAE